MGSSLTGVSLGVSVGLGCFCLEACVYSGVLEFVPGKPSPYSLFPGPYPRSLLSFSLCLMGRFTDHQPNARSAQTGEVDKLMERSADHDPTGWNAPYGCGVGGVLGCAKARLGAR